MNSHVLEIRPVGQPDYWEDVSASESAVVLVTEYMGHDERVTAWTTYEKALAYAETSQYPAVIDARVLDTPDWGNVESN